MRSHFYPRDLALVAAAAVLAAFLAAAVPVLPAAVAWPIGSAVAAAAVAGAGLYAYRSILRLIHWAADQDAKQHQDGYRQIEAFLQLQRLIPVRLPLPSMRGMAISPDFALLLVSEILQRRPAVLVELGSGVSTLVSGYCFQQIGAGRVLSLDHHPTYADITRQNVARHGLGDVATVYDAPLCDTRVEELRLKYYDLSAIAGVNRIDMLVVDGPPAMLGPLARYPALPLLHEKLADDAVILVDDTGRPEDRAVVEKWAAAYPDFECRFVECEKGAAMLRRKRA